MNSRWLCLLGGVSLWLPAALPAGSDDTPPAGPSPEWKVEHAECSYFGAGRERFVSNALAAAGSSMPRPDSLSAVTDTVNRMLATEADAPRRRSFAVAPKAGSIDSYIYADLQANGIQPADKTTDIEFIRRVTLDLTGRIPRVDRILTFTADPTPDKRAQLIDELLARTEWVDKWTMFFGDLYKNTANTPSSGVRRFTDGRNAFYTWIRNSLVANKPYNQMATELITAAGDNSYQTGTINFLVGAIVSGGPQQDITDSMTADTMETFLGLSHVNCLLCHNGRGHLDSLSLWGRNTTRYQAWQLSSFLSHTQPARQRVDTANPNVYYWSQRDDTKGFTNDYALNTSSGNRPARQPLQSGCRAGQPCYYVAPAYFFTGEQPKAGENYRAALARMVTADFQFARATVNYIWKQFFGRGLVEPVNAFDPARLDPDNPPPDPWTLQPSNARLLNALAQGFIENNYDLKWLMRQITTSDTYQMSGRYNGTWKAEYESYFARKLVRRLWAEEIHDAVAQSAFTNQNYSVPGFSNQGFPNINFAMQAPDVVGTPTAAVAVFLDAFLRGNRDDTPRKDEGSVQQALNLMNDPFLVSRVQVTGNNANQLILSNLGKPDEDLVTALFLNILSRYPTDSEKSRALAALKVGTRAQGSQDIVWALYNKVDFVFNY